MTFLPCHTIWNSFRNVLGGSLAPWIHRRRRAVVYKSYGILRTANTPRIHLYQYSVTLRHSIVLLLLMCSKVTCRPNACSATRLAMNLKTFPINSNTLFSEANPSLICAIIAKFFKSPRIIFQVYEKQWWKILGGRC